MKKDTSKNEEKKRKSTNGRYIITLLISTSITSLEERHGRNRQ
jgi:hypothetical protein